MKKATTVVAEQKEKASSSRMSTSFSEAEIRVMNDIFAVLRRGGDASLFARSKEAKHVAAKFYAASVRLESGDQR